MRKTYTRAFRLLGGCWRTLVLFEILYRLFSAYVAFPACKWLFSNSLRATGFHYLTLENALAVLTHPLMLGCFIAIFLIFSLVLMLEISGLITCLYTTRGDRTLNVFQIIREAGRDTLRLLQPRNFPLLLITAFLTPLQQLTANASLLRLTNLPWRSVVRAAVRFPLVLVVAGYLLLSLLVFAAIMCVYQKYVIEDIPAGPSIRGALQFSRGQRLLRLGQFAVWMGVGLGIVLLGSALITQGLSRLILLFTSDLNIQYRVMLPITTIITFIRSSVPPLAAYAFIGAVYEQANPQEIIPRHTIVYRQNAHRFNAIVFYAAMALCLLGLALYDSVLRPTLVRLNALEYVLEHPTLVIAHRGYFPDTDENTLSAFQSAIEVGVDYVELDVQQTADGVVIVNHDNNFRRIYGVKRSVWTMRYGEVCALSARRSGEHPPTLEEVLTLCDPQANFLIELKNNGHNPDLVQAVYDVLVETESLDRCIIQSSTYKLLHDFKQLAPDMRCGYILSFALGSYANLSAADFFSLDYNFVDQRIVDDIHRSGKALLMWTLNDAGRIAEALELGADGIITDDAPLAKTLLLEQLAANPLEELIIEPLGDVLMPEEGEAEIAD